MTQEFVSLENRMNFFVVIITEIAFSHQVYTSDIIIWEGH